MDRRDFLKNCCLLISSGVVAGGLSPDAWAKMIHKDYDPAKQYYGMGIDINKCIGCGRCMQACKTENDVPGDPYYFRTWVERYVIKVDKSVTVKTISTTLDDPADVFVEKDMLRSFFVPKLCNQCDHPPCVQVCPVGATFKTIDGVTLVDDKRCIGCRYCIQACPYGARYLHPLTRVADKCTFCYHRLVRGLLPVCVEVCPKQARLFGDMKSIASPLGRFTRMNKIHVLKPSLNTDPKVYYANLDGEVN
jgi:Fe-S-cluster-containing dehydrogenase component